MNKVLMKLSPKALETVKEVRTLLSDESKWTQEYYARNVDGGLTNSTSFDAVCWCLEGAFNKVLFTHDGGIPPVLIMEIEDKCFPNDSIVSFNDRYDFATVSQRLDEIISENEE